MAYDTGEDRLILGNGQFNDDEDRKDYAWSPDSRFVAVHGVVNSDVPNFFLYNVADGTLRELGFAGASDNRKAFLLGWRNVN